MNFVLAIDQSLGKVDKHSLSQQTIMELLIEGISNKETICGSNESPNDITEWPKLIFNDAKEVKRITWSQRSLEGSIEFKWLPPTAYWVNVSVNQLHGTADLSSLPDVLVYFTLSKNAFEGSVDLTQLPPMLGKLFLYQNNFSGQTDFSLLPKSLEYLNVSNTQMEGEVLTFDGQLVIEGSNVKDLRNN